MAYKFDDLLTEKNFTSKNANTNSNDFVDVWEYKVPAGQEIVVGTGKIMLGVDNRGEFRVELKNSSGNAIGNYKVRVIKRDANNILNIQQFHALDDNGDGVVTKRVGMGGNTGNEPINPDSQVIREDQKAVVQVMKVDGASATIDFTKSKITLPITVKALR